MSNNENNTAGHGGDASSQQAGEPTNDQSQIQQTAPPMKSQEPNKDELDKLITKAREDEKKKVFGKITELEKQLADARNSAKQSEDNLKNTRADLDALKEGGTSEVAILAKELKEVREQSAKLEVALEEVSKAAVQKVYDLEMKTLKERLVVKEKLSDHLIEFVSGSSEEELLASIKTVKEKEEAIVEAARAAVEAEYAKKLPKPVNPDGAQGRKSLSASSIDRKALMNLPEAEFEKRQSELLAEALKKSGLR